METRRTAACRHCEEELVEFPGNPEASRWQTRNGGMTCCGQPYGKNIPHLPMPPGFRGAP